MKKIIVFVLFVETSTFAFSQTEATSLKKSITSVYLNILAPGVSYERHLKGLFTLKSALEFGFSFGQSIFGTGTYFILTPVLISEPRYYYNFRHRVKKGKKTSYNASEYFALTASYASDIVIKSASGFVRAGEPEFSLIPKWGFKRTVGRKFFFEMATGIGLSFSKTETAAGYGLDLRFGYIIK